MNESLTAARYQEPSLESFCDSLIREKYNLIHPGVINNADTSGKALLFQQKEKSKPPKKHNFCNNKQNKLMILPGCTNLTTLGHHLFLQFLLLIVIT